MGIMIGKLGKRIFKSVFSGLGRFCAGEGLTLGADGLATSWIRVGGAANPESMSTASDLITVRDELLRDHLPVIFTGMHQTVCSQLVP